MAKARPPTRRGGEAGHTADWWSGTRSCCTLLSPSPPPESGGLAAWPISCLLLPCRQDCSWVQVRGWGKGGPDWPVRQLPPLRGTQARRPPVLALIPLSYNCALRGRQTRFQMSHSPSHLLPHLISLPASCPEPTHPSQVVGEMPTARVLTGYQLTFKLLFRLKSTPGLPYSSWKVASLRVILFVCFCLVNPGLWWLSSVCRQGNKVGRQPLRRVMFAQQ